MIIKKDFNEIKLKEKGITLIALVITIIVLLILVAVSIAMLTGKNGILSKASTAKEKHLIAQYEEELNLCITEMQTDELGTLTMQKLIENLPQYIQTEQPGEQYEWKTDQTAEEPTGIYKGYEFYVDKNKKAHITGKATGIMISCSVEPSGYTNKNVKATITITCTEGIQSIKQTKPTEETTITASGTEYTIVKENIESNTTFEYEVTDSNGNTETKTAQVTNIDTLPPKTAQINVENVTEGLKISVTAEDEDENEKNAKSGIGSYKYYIDGELKETSTKNTCIIKNLTLNQEYSVYVEVYDRAENKKQTETTKITRKIPLKVKEISAADDSSSAIDEQGRIWMWGHNYKGRLGVGTDSNILSPQFIETETRFKEINLGEYISMAKDEENNLWAWGANNSGQLGDGTTNDTITPTKTNYGINFSKISIGSNSNIALDENKNIWTWGWNNNCQLGDGTTKEKLVPTKVESMKNINFKDISAGKIIGWNIALDEDGYLWVCGCNSWGQLGNGGNSTVTKFTKISTQTKFKKIVAGYTHTLAIDEENNLWSCGNNGDGQLGDGTTENRNTMKQITFGTKFKDIYAGNGLSYAIDEQENIWAWGYNKTGFLGNGANENITKPTQITYDVKFKKISVGRYHTLAIDEENNLWSWGTNNSGQLGDGTTTSSNKPKKIN